MCNVTKLMMKYMHVVITIICLVNFLSCFHLHFCGEDSNSCFCLFFVVVILLFCYLGEERCSIDYSILI